MTEIPQPQIVESPNHLKVESPAVSRKLRIDALDRGIQSYSSAAHWIGGLSAGVGLIIPGLTDSIMNGFNRPNFPAYLAASTIVGFTSFYASLYKPAEMFYRERQLRKIEASHSIQNFDPKYNAERVVYKGNGLTADGFRLNKGDNIYYVHLPGPRTAESNNPTIPSHISAEQLMLLSRYYSLILKDLRGKIAQRDFQGVVLDFGFILNPGDETLRRYGRASQVGRDKLLEGKNIRQTDQTSTTLLLPREILEALPLSPTDVFNRTIDALEGEIGIKLAGRELISRLRNLGKTDRDKRLEEAAALRHRLDNLFNMQAESRFNTLPNVSIERTPLGPVRKKSQTHPLLKVTRNSKGVFLEEVSYLRGNRRFLVKLDVPIEDALAAGSKDRMLLLTYALSEMLSSPEKVMESTEEEILDAGEIERKLRETGIILKLPGKLSVLPKSYNFLKGARDIALAGVIGIGAIDAVSTIPAIPELPHIISIDLPFGHSGTSQTGEGIGNISLNHLEDKEKTSLGGYPPSHLDWKIYDHEGMSPDGYYITSTSHDYKDGGWVINNKPEDAEKLDTNKLSSTFYQLEDSYLRLEGVVDLDFFKNARFRLPIREGTTLSKISIATLDLKQLDPNSYNIYKFNDGTFMVDVSLDMLSSLTAIRVEYSLVESEEGPHAAQRIASVDVNNLSPEAYELLQQSGNNLDNLREKVSLDKPYSIDPPNKDVLNGLDGTAEAVINAIEKLEGSDCDTSNTEFALLSSAIATSDFVNTAKGYLGISAGGSLESVNGMSPGGFLNNNMSHRFSISNSGAIFDATAGNGLLGDGMTKEYFDSIMVTPGDYQRIKAETEWENNAVSEQQKQLLFGNIQLILELGGLAGAVIFAPKGVEAIRRKITKDRVDRARNKARALRLLRRSSVSDMEEAYRFFNWMSFGGEKQFARFSEVPVEFWSREEMAKRIKKGVLEHNLRSYLQKPDDFEQQAGIKNSRKLRRIARYLLY